MYSPPVPLYDDDSDLFFLYPEEKEKYEESKRKKIPFISVMRPLFRALGWMGSGESAETESELQTMDNPEPKLKESTKIARRKKSGGLFER